jgi:hypothetical protein
MEAADATATKDMAEEMMTDAEAETTTEEAEGMTTDADHAIAVAMDHVATTDSNRFSKSDFFKEIINRKPPLMAVFFLFPTAQDSSGKIIPAKPGEPA